MPNLYQTASGPDQNITNPLPKPSSILATPVPNHYQTPWEAFTLFEKLTKACRTLTKQVLENFGSALIRVCECFGEALNIDVVVFGQGLGRASVMSVMVW